MSKKIYFSFNLREEDLESFYFIKEKIIEREQKLGNLKSYEDLNNTDIWRIMLREYREKFDKNEEKKIQKILELKRSIFQERINLNEFRKWRQQV